MLVLCKTFLNSSKDRYYLVVLFLVKEFECSKKVLGDFSEKGVGSGFPKSKKR